jgi:hypothetical protein
MSTASLLINKKMRISTPGYGISIFDLETLQPRIHQSMDWWDGTFPEEVKSGLITLFEASQPYFKLRISSGDLTSQEKDFAVSVSEPMGFSCVSGNVFMGASIWLPSDDSVPSLKKTPKDEGIFFKLPIGDYDVLVYQINAKGYVADRIFEQLPSVVILISPRTTTFTFLSSLPQLVNCQGISAKESFLFPSDKNAEKLRPKLNKVINAVIFKSFCGKLILKEPWGKFWPSSYSGYEIVLEDMSQINWHDRIKLKTVAFDEGKKIIYGVLLEKLPKKEG